MRVPLFGAILLVVLSILVDTYIWGDIRRYAVRHRKFWSWFYTVSSVLCWAFLIVILCLPKRNPEDPILAVMWMLFSFLSVYIAKTVYAICSAIGRIFSRKKRRNYGIFVGIPLALLVFITMWWGALITRYELEVNEVEIVSDRLPQSMDGLTMLQFSDAHVGTWGNDTTFISMLVDSINACNADIIVFTGDIVNRESSELEPFRKIFARLKAPLGVYAILGNHDYSSYVDWPVPEDRYSDMDRLNGWIGEMGWDLLKNESRFISNGKDSIALIGVENWGEPPFNTYGNLGASYAPKDDPNHNLYDSTYKILLTHNPEHWAQVALDTSNIDLSLAGHTHAMQAMIKIGDWKWSPAVFRYKRWGGLYTEKGTDGTPMNLYVNIGCGEVGFPARIGATPELTLFTFHHAPSNGE